MSLVIKEIKELSSKGVAPPTSYSSSLYKRALAEFGTWEQACKRAGVVPRSGGYINYDMREIHREINQMTPAVWSFCEALVKACIKDEKKYQNNGSTGIDGRNLYYFDGNEYECCEKG